MFTTKTIICFLINTECVCQLIMSLSFGACKDHMHANSVSKSNKTAERICKNAIFTLENTSLPHISALIRSVSQCVSENCVSGRNV